MSNKIDEHVAVFTNLVNRETIGQGEKSLYLPKFGTVTCEDLTDGVDMANSQTMTITGTTHTTDEAGCKVVVTKKMRNHLKESAFRAAGIVIGNAMGKKMDRDGLALFSGLSGGLGADGTTFAIDYLLAAHTQMDGQTEPAPFPRSCILHPYMVHEIVDRLATPSSSVTPPALQTEALRAYWRGGDKLFNSPVFGDGNIVITAATETAYGALFSKAAFIYVVGWEPDTWTVYDDSLRGWEIGIVADYKMVEEDGTYGRYMFFECAAPTS